MGSEMMGMMVDARAFPVSTFSKDFGGVEFLEGFSLTLLPMKSRTRHASRMPMQGVGMLHTIHHIKMHCYARSVRCGM